MIYKVTLYEDGKGAALEEIHLRAATITEAIEKAMRYGSKVWETEVRVGRVEETHISFVDEDDTGAVG